MVYKHLCILVLWTKVASALKGLNILPPPICTVLKRIEIFISVKELSRLSQCANSHNRITAIWNTDCQDSQQSACTSSYQVSVVVIPSEPFPQEYPARPIRISRDVPQEINRFSHHLNVGQWLRAYYLKVKADGSNLSLGLIILLLVVSGILLES